MTYQSRVHKSHGLLPSCYPLLVDPVQHGRKYRRGSRGSSYQCGSTLVEDQYVITYGRDVRVTAANAVVDPAVSSDTTVVGGRVVRIRRVGGSKICRYRVLLVSWDGVDVGEATAGRETRDGDFLILRSAGIGRQECSSSDGEVWTGRWEVRREDGARGAETTVWIIVPGWTSHARVAGCDDDGDALHAELHVFVALAFLVGSGQVGFLTAVGYGDHIRGLVDSALQASLVAAWVGVGVGGVERAVAGFAEGRIGAVGAIDGVQEVI